METTHKPFQGYGLLLRPHSLGKLIEWKLFSIRGTSVTYGGPHSLGKLIEWKLRNEKSRKQLQQEVPTRWGN